MLDFRENRWIKVFFTCGKHIFSRSVAADNGKDPLIGFLFESLFSSWRLGPFGIYDFFDRVGAVKKRR